MQNSASVELVEMKRAEKNASGKSIDTICGYVRGKSASGLDTGDRPFLYLVQEDQAYIGLYDIATSREVKTPLEAFAMPTRRSALLGRCSANCTSICHTLCDLFFFI